MDPAGRASIRGIEFLDYSFGFFLCLGADNVRQNLSGVYHRPSVLTKLSLIAAVLQIMDVILLAVQHSVQTTFCEPIVNLGSTCYYVFQIISSDSHLFRNVTSAGILIYRATTIFSPNYIPLARILLSLLLVASIVTNAAFLPPNFANYLPRWQARLRSPFYA
ncbi:hypothetical protein DFJ77DRAFT_97278 [Powellomyces hirtus]|nr:hypothetical protein DFJ77DRAFT_97278 [Powellomyces hirtus]